MVVARSLGNAAEQQLRRVCEELDRALRSGQHVRAETYFGAWPLLAARVEQAVELIYAEFAAREELGQRPTPEEYYLRFPCWKEQLHRQFAVHEWLGASLGSALPPALPLLKPEREPVGASSWLGQYELLEEIARGGCGRVYRAWQHGLERPVAVKVLPPEVGCIPEARERFCHEAKVMARLRHPNVMPIHDVGECRGVAYFSMDFLPGGSLAERLAAAGPAGVPVRTALLWVEAVARAADYAHSRGVIHCDLKPSNVLLNDVGQPVVTDFGLAELGGSREADGPGAVVGSPAYMAPEQLSGGPLTPAVDVWALGVMLYEFLAGQRPFLSDQFAALERLICGAPAPPLRARARGVGERLEAVVLKCLSKDAAQRYSSADALAEDLHACLN
jgi:serine/threonine-protein kinase